MTLDMSHLLIVCWFLDTSSFLLHDDREGQGLPPGLKSKGRQLLIDMIV